MAYLLPGRRSLARLILAVDATRFSEGRLYLCRLNTSVNFFNQKRKSDFFFFYFEDYCFDIIYLKKWWFSVGGC